MIGKIYLIRGDDEKNDECYVGHTFKTLEDRLIGHKAIYDRREKGIDTFTAVYKLFDKYGYDNCSITLIKNYNVIDKRHLEVYENLWINKLNCVNISNPVGGLLLKQYRKLYREKNKDKLNEYSKIYREEHKDEIREKDKIRYDKNREAKLAQKKIYWKKNKAKISEKRKVKVLCECGSYVGKYDIHKHRRTQKHLKNLNKE